MHDVSCGFSINVLYKVEVKSYSYSSPVLISILLLLFFECFYHGVGFPGSSDGKNLPAMQETWVLSLGWEDPLG